jgi:predicted CXXCH cytochrome family protein
MGRCLLCHAPHGSANEHMVVRPGAALCTGCHARKSPGMAAKHPGMNLAAVACSSCHDPHVQAKTAKGLLRPAQHLPFARRQCESCHTSRGSASLTAKGADLCLKCHETFRPVLARPVVHAPLRGEKACVACHDPHAGAAAPILAAKADQLCWRCHDRALVKGKQVHAALEQGCGSCHDPHASDHQRLLSRNVDDLCRTCHTDLSKHHHPTGGEGAKPDARTGDPLTCVSCHRPHAGDEVALLTHEPKRELCAQCHDPGVAPPPGK